MTVTASPTRATEVQDRLAGLLDSTPALYLSTVGEDGPWCAGGFFTARDPYTLLMVLEASGRTLRNLRSRPEAAVVVSSGSPFEPFAQGAAVVHELDRSERDGVAAALRAKVPQIEPLLSAPVEAVRVEVATWKVTDILAGWLPAKVLTR